MVYITTPAILSCCVAFFSDPYFKISNFFIHLVCVLFINSVMDYEEDNCVILHSA